MVPEDMGSEGARFIKGWKDSVWWSRYLGSIGLPENWSGMIPGVGAGLELASVDEDEPYKDSRLPARSSKNVSGYALNGLSDVNISRDGIGAKISLF